MTPGLGNRCSILLSYRDMGQSASIVACRFEAQDAKAKNPVSNAYHPMRDGQQDAQTKDHRFLRADFRLGLLRFGFGAAWPEAILKIDGNSSANMGCNSERGTSGSAGDSAPGICS